MSNLEKSEKENVGLELKNIREVIKHFKNEMYEEIKKFDISEICFFDCYESKTDDSAKKRYTCLINFYIKEFKGHFNYEKVIIVRNNIVVEVW